MHGSVNGVLAQIHREELLRAAEEERLRRSARTGPGAIRRLLVLLPMRHSGLAREPQAPPAQPAATRPAGASRRPSGAPARRRRWRACQAPSGPRRSLARPCGRRPPSGPVASVSVSPCRGPRPCCAGPRT